MRSIRRRLAFLALIATAGWLAANAADPPDQESSAPRWRQHDIRRPKPPVVAPADATIAARPPADAVVLFGGSNLDAWQAPGGGPAKWKIRDGFMETAPGSGPIETKKQFGDIQLHVEWAAPHPPAGVGQDRGNSGVFLMGEFEIQVLDSFKAETYADGQAGAIYGQYPPSFNASRPPGEWQSYDIAFRRPRFDAAGRLLEPARITLFHNGILVQDNEEPFGPTSWLKWLPYSTEQLRGPIKLQDHDHPVRYRNIWLREIPERIPPTAKELARPPVVSLSADVLDRYVGQYLMSDKPNAPKATFRREQGHLVVSFEFRPQSLILEPISETEFDLPFTDGRFTFQKDEQGRVTGTHFRIGDGERSMKKVNSSSP